MEVTPLLTTLLIVLMVLFEHGISGQMHPSEGKNTLITPSFRAYQLNKPKTTIAAKSRLTTKASNRPITTTKRIGKTTKPIKNQQLQKTTKTTPKKIIVLHTGSKTINKAIIIQPHTTIPRTMLYSPLNREYALPPNFFREISPSEDTSPANVTKPTEDYVYYGNLTTKEWPELYDDLTASTEVPNTSTVEEVTRKRLKRRKTTTSDPTTSTRRRLKRTRSTTVGQGNA